MDRWCVLWNPFILLIGFSLFNMFNHLSFKNAMINYFSSLSLIIYLVHENIIVRKYVRPVLFKALFDFVKVKSIFVFVMIASLIVFCSSVIISILYKISVFQICCYFSKHLYAKIKK